MALMIGVLTTMMLLTWALALLPMAGQEAQIAANLAAASQARACAESGLEYVLTELNQPGGAPWSSGTLDVDGHTICTFLAGPVAVSATEVRVTTTATLVETPTPGTSAATQSYVLDTTTGVWRVKMGTFRGR